MKLMIFILVLNFLALNVAFSQVSAPGKMRATVQLSVGSFEIDAAISGYGKFKGDKLKTSKLVLKCGDIDSGIGLRDTHVKKHMKCGKYPKVIISKIKGSKSKGRGVADILFAGVKKRRAFSFKLLQGGKVLCTKFAVSLSQHKIKGVSYNGIGVEDSFKISACIPIK